MFFGMPARPVARGIRNEFERIRGTGIFGLRVVVEVADARLGIEHHVFQHGAEAERRRVDLRLGLRRQLDALGVAAAFEIEHALRAPAVLVVADQRAVGIGRQRRLAGAGQPEEQRDVAGRSDIGGAVHRHHALGRQVVIERGEHRLLHFAGVGGAADQDDALVKSMATMVSLRTPWRLGSALNDGSAEDGEVRHVMRKLGALGTDQQRADEHRMPGELGDRRGP